MRRPVVLLMLAALALRADERWIEFRSGPFEVRTSAGERAGRETLAKLEQFRHALESVSGRSELQTVWPVRLLVFKSARERAAYASETALGLGRDAFTGSVAAREPLPPALLRDCAVALLTEGTGRAPSEIEEGLVELFSTLAIEGQRITLGLPPAPAARTPRWARMHLLAVTPEYYGKLRVLARNLASGGDEEVAYRNAFGKPPAAIEKETDAYLAKGNFGTVDLSGRPMNPERDFTAKPVEAPPAAAAAADLLLAVPAKGAQARAAYEAMLKQWPGSAEAQEGLGLLALREGRMQEARQHLGATAEASMAGARALLEYGRREPDTGKARTALERAAERNPRWAAPHWELARVAPDTKKKVEHLRKATSLEPRNAGYWIELAGALQAVEEPDEAAKAWASAERIAANKEERERIRGLRAEARRALEEQQIAARQKEQEEKRRELERLKEEAMARIRLAEAKANVGSPPPDPGRKVERWWDDPRPRSRARGVLQKIDCLGKRYRLVIAGDDGKTVQLLLPDSTRVVITGGERTFACGPQKPPRKISVEYYVSPDAKLGTAGELAVIEFQ